MCTTWNFEDHYDKPRIAYHAVKSIGFNCNFYYGTIEHASHISTYRKLMVIIVGIGSVLNRTEQPSSRIGTLESEQVNEVIVTQTGGSEVGFQNPHEIQK